MKIATWNINSVNARLHHLVDFIKSCQPDILLLQEIKCINEKFPQDILDEFGYNIYLNGQKSYNGVAILSKFQADEISYNFKNNPLPLEARYLEIQLSTMLGYLTIASLYAPNGGEVGSEKFKLKLDFYDQLILYLNSKKALGEKIIIGGDFNIAPFDIDVFSPMDLYGSLCFTNIEKQKLRILLNNGFVDLYRQLNNNTKEFSWWDYRSGCFEQNKGMRIDTILASCNIATSFNQCYIDYKERCKLKPSDHAPVIIL